MTVKVYLTDGRNVDYTNVEALTVKNGEVIVQYREKGAPKKGTHKKDFVTNVFTFVQ